MTNHTPQEVEKIAKAIVEKWGYEEEYWWRPIASALSTQRAKAREELDKIIQRHIDISPEPSPELEKAKDIQNDIARLPSQQT